MVYVAMKQTNEMLDENYYVREQEYQSLIDGAHALQSIQTEPLIKQNSQYLIIHLPENSFDDLQDAEVNFIKPDNEKLDISFPLEPNQDGECNIDKTELTKGVYKIRVKWKNGDQQYYSDENLYID